MTALGSSGCLVKHTMSHPSAEGTLIHFETPSGDFTNALTRVTKAGGKIVSSKTSIGKYGFYAFVADTKGNTIGLHAKK